MSDVFSIYNRNELEWKLSISTEFPLRYVRQQAAHQYEFLFCLVIPWPLLLIWSEIVEDKSIEASYIDLFNATSSDSWFVLKRDCVRIEKLLYKNASVVKQICRKATGRKKKDLEKNVYKLSIRRNEVETVESLKSELEICQSEVEEWKRNYNDLKAEKEKLYENMRNEFNKQKEELEDLQDVNKHLTDYVEQLEINNSIIKCQGKKIHELGVKQQKRKLRLLQNKAQCGLWFCESFGLNLTEIKFQDEEGSTHKMDFSTSNNAGNRLEQLEDDDKNKVEQILFLLDKFCVGDEVYHELAMATEDLPKSYLIKQKRNDLNKIYHIERNPGKYPEASINFTSTLQDHIRELLCKNPDLKEGKIKVKLSGDGARMSRTTNFMMMSFTLLQLNECVMSSKHNRTVTIVNGPEEYETLHESLSILFSEVNQLIDKGTISIDGEDVELEFFLGGDLKFLLMMLGLNSASSNYACLWCKVHKNDRWDTSKPANYYNQIPMRRTLEDIKTDYNTKENYGCIHYPLLNIPLTHVIPDELHLLLRITDRLLQNVVDEVLERDVVEDFNKPRGQPKGEHLSALVKAINDLGISFSIWNKRNADGSESQVKEFTSLLGSQKKKLLKGLPSKLHDFLYPESCTIVEKIWTDFGQLYDTISDFNLTDTAAMGIFDEARAWIDTFCSLRGARPGYTRPRVTPYMHLLVYHIPFFVEKHGCLKQFTGQGVEKNNDDAKRIMFHKSNKWDAARDIILTESRQWDLRHQERIKAMYTKRKLEYWGHDISVIRNQKRLQMSSFPLPEDDVIPTPIPDPNEEHNYNNLTVKQLKEIVKGMGLKPKGLAKLKKQELIALVERS